MKYFKKHGIVLFTVLCVMVILLIISLSIVTLSTGSIRTMGNINSRFQALNLANSACMYGIYELETNWATVTAWGPGYMPGPPSSMSFITRDITGMNGIKGKCKVAYVDNLNNPQKGTVIGGPSFYPSLTSTDIYGETAMIIGQGEYNGFKRTVKVTVKHTYFGSGVDGSISLGNDKILVTGIENINTLSPGSGTLYSHGDITYNALNSYSILNGSLLCTNGNIPAPSSGVTIDQRFLEPNQTDIIGLVDWNLNDPNLTDGDPVTDYTPVACPTEPSGLDANSICRPSFNVDPDIGDIWTYYHEGRLTVDHNTFVNGSLYVSHDMSGGTMDGNIHLLNNASLFVNGILKIDGTILNSSYGNIYVAGYVDPNTPDPNTRGMALKIGEVNQYTVDRRNSHGVAVFTDGDISIGPVPRSWEWTGMVDEWYQKAPEDIMKVAEVFNMLGLQEVDAATATAWYNNSNISKALVGFPGISGRQILQGVANYKLVDKGLKPVPDDVAYWFKYMPSECSDWIENISWDTFKYNPSLYTGANDVFLQGVFFTHGDFYTTNWPGTYAWWPVRIVGNVITHKTSVSPPGHNGDVRLNGASSIILYEEYFNQRSGKIPVKPILTIYSWQEL